MNPIKNKKNLEATIDDIRNFAYLYLEKYSPSKQQLRTYLFKKLIIKRLKISNKKEIFHLIDSVISFNLVFNIFVASDNISLAGRLPVDSKVKLNVEGSSVSVSVETETGCHFA